MPRYLEQIDRTSGVGERFPYPSPEATLSLRNAAYVDSTTVARIKAILEDGHQHATAGYIRQIVTREGIVS